MLKKFEVKNYRNFKDSISVDFSRSWGYRFNEDCLSDGLLSKMLLLGENASGKSNFGRAITDIKSVLIAPSAESDVSFLNADSSDDYAEFSYLFQLGDDEVHCLYRKKAPNSLCYEEISINGANLFTNTITETVTITTGTGFPDSVNTQMYARAYSGCSDLGSRAVLPFSRWLIFNAALSEDSVLMRLYRYVTGMDFISSQAVTDPITFNMENAFLEMLYKDERIKDLEDFLNAMGVICKLDLQVLPDNTFELYFSHRRNIPFFQNASSSTLELFNIFKSLYTLNEPTFIYVDNFSAFSNSETAEKLIGYIKRKYPKCQVIFSTHNTKLIKSRIMRPDCVFLLSEGSITSLCEATSIALNEGHDLEKMYKKHSCKD